MDSQRWERIQTLFHDAADLPAPEQQAFLKAACGDDQGLLSEVSGMLEEDARGACLLSRDLAHVAQETLDSTTTSFAGNKEFGPYHIQKPLGEGGMGVVYLAERRDLGSRVAIKILRDAWLSPSRRERTVIVPSWSVPRTRSSMAWAALTTRFKTTWLSSPRVSTMASAARQARCAWSGCWSGAPHMAISSSPM